MGVPQDHAAESGGEAREGGRVGTIVRNPVRKLMGLAVIGVLGALFAMPVLTAAAQTTPSPTASAASCTITSVVPRSLPAGGGTVTGTAPAGSTVVFYFNGVPATPAVTQVVGPDGNFSLGSNGSSSGAVSVRFSTGPDDYPPNVCTDLSGENVFKITVSPASAAAPAAKALAFTGSNNTPSYVLVGIAALVLGAVLVIAARRRSRLS
jgi:LPXTG-motif cell wall-anchored protein